MIDRIEYCLNKKTSKLPDEVVNIHGMTSIRIRHFLNNLMEMPNAKYLEVGVWQGATFMAALYGNSPKHAYAVDDFSAGHKSDFLQNTSGVDYILFEGDAFDFKPKKKINIYLYDANKTEADVYRALEHYYPFLEDEFIYMVDDYNYLNAQAGTRRAIRDLGLDVRYFNHLGKREYNELHTGEWWLGFLISVLRK